MQMPIEVLIADDHVAVREGLRFILERATETAIAVLPEEAKTGDEAVALYHKLHPTVAIFDVKMPGKSGVQAAIEILEVDLRANIVLYSAHGEPSIMTEALKAGCRGYVLKSATAHDILRAIVTVAGGGLFVDPTLAVEIVTAPSVATPALTVREIEVLTLMANGKTTTQIAKLLIISPETVRTHVRHANEKLSAENRPHAVALAIRYGLINVTDL